MRVGEERKGYSLQALERRDDRIVVERSRNTRTRASAIESLLWAYVLFHRLDGARLIGPDMSITVMNDHARAEPAKEPA